MGGRERTDEKRKGPLGRVTEAFQGRKAEERTGRQLDGSRRESEEKHDALSVNRGGDMGTVVVEEEKPFSALKKARQAQRTPLCSGCPTHRSPGRRILSSRARPNSTTTALSLPLSPSPVTLTPPQLSMANPRQRSKARSKTHRAIRTTSKQKAKKVTVKGPAALVENWDTKKTVLQKWVQRAGGCGCGGCTGEREGLSGRARRAVRSPTVPLSETRALHLVSFSPPRAQHSNPSRRPDSLPSSCFPQLQTSWSSLLARPAPGRRHRADARRAPTGHWRPPVHG